MLIPFVGEPRQTAVSQKAQVCRFTNGTLPLYIVSCLSCKHNIVSAQLRMMFDDLRIEIFVVAAIHKNATSANRVRNTNIKAVLF